MANYILKRLAQSLLTLFVIVTIVFLLLRQMPEEGYIERYDKLTHEQREVLLTNMGLRDPVLVQLKNFYTSLIRGDLGRSSIYRPRVKITSILSTKVPYSLAFGLGSMSISLVTGILLGIVMAWRKAKFPDKLGTAFIVAVNAVPAAIYHLFLQLYLTNILKLPILFSPDNPASWVLPLISMSLGSTAYYAMWMRRYMVDELNKDYIKLARVKGLPESKIMIKHVFRNAVVPLIQYIPTSLLYTVAGSIYVESLYSIPGMGGLLVDVIQRQDNTLVQALVLIYASLGIIALLLGDVLMAVFDPRIKLNKGGEAR